MQPLSLEFFQVLDTALGQEPMTCDRLLTWEGSGSFFFADGQQARLSFRHAPGPCVAFVVWAVFLVDFVFVDSESV